MVDKPGSQYPSGESKDDLTAQAKGEMASGMKAVQKETDTESAVDTKSGGGEQSAEGKWVTVRQGESAESIAFKNGHFWETVWNDANNSKLKKKREDPHTLFPDDELFVPKIRPKHEDGATEEHHKFRRKGMPSKVTIKLERDNKPRANEPYRFEIQGGWIEGTTKKDGKVELPIHPLAKAGKLFVGVGEDQTVHEIKLRHLDPATTPSGANARLFNLGYLWTDEGDDLTPLSKHALRLFQKEHGLSGDGELTPETSDKLKEVHGV